MLTPGTTLDGELVVLDLDGRVDFVGIRRRCFGQTDPGRLVFVAFDVLALAGEDVMAPGLGVPGRIRLRWEAKLGYDRIAKLLNEEGIKPKRAAAASAMSVRSVLIIASRLSEDSSAA